MGPYLPLAFLFVLLTTSVFLGAMNSAQTQPYMDEIFHVPQARQYCAGNFTTWDPMITTLPGLYLVSLPLLYPVALMSEGGNLPSVCTTLVLRGINIIFTVGNLYLLYLLTYRLHFNGKNMHQVILTAVALGTFPILYFFTFLYYTDPAAVFFTLLTYHLVLTSRPLAAAAAGIAAIICRQTNVVWVVFAAGFTTGKILLQWTRLDKRMGDRGEKPVSDWLVLSKTFSLIGHSVRHDGKEVKNLVKVVVRGVWCYMVVGAAFAGFVVVNKGIVVGDRSNHQPCLNFPQLFYFLLISTFFSFMHMVSVKKITEFIKYTFCNPIKTAMFVLFAVLFISKFMYIHDYNLADNRHYNFYFLSKLVMRNKFAKYVLIPAYYYAFVTFLKLLEHRDIFWKLSFFICSTVCMVPQRMIEFRYFILPYLVFRLNMPLASKLLLMIEVLFYLLINVGTVYMYTARPFRWANSEALQRFMW